MLPIVPSRRLSGLLKLPPEVEGVERVEGAVRRRVYKDVVAYGLPSMGGFMVSSFNEMVDLFWLARIGTAPVAAVTVFMTIFWTLMTFNIIAGVGSNSIISRRFGEGTLSASESAIRSAFVLKFGLGTVVGLLTILVIPYVLAWMGTEPEVEALAYDYGIWMLAAAGLVGCSYSVYSAFRCIGLPNMALAMQALGAGMNLVLDPLLIFGWGPFPEWGIRGAAIATVCSHVAVTTLGLLLLARKTGPVPVRWFSRPWPSFQEYRTIWRIGWPVGINVLSFSVSAAVAVKLVAVYGTDVVAIFGAAGKVLHFGVMSMVGFTLGTAALVGQYLGAKERIKSWLAGIYSIRLAGWIMLAYGGITFVFADQIISMFFGANVHADMGRVIMRIMALSLPLIGVHIGSETVFEGAGHNKPMMHLSIAHAWLMVVPFMYVLGPVLQFGPIGMMWGWTTAHCLGGLVAVWLFYRGSWLRAQV